MRDNGIFITLEGIDGSGKTTHIQYIKELFEQESFTVVTTREPGGTPMAEKIRSVLLEGWGDEDVDPLTEAMLFSSSRKQHLENFIKPHLAQGHVVISDRYVDSMLAYQHAARGCEREKLMNLCSMVCGDNGWPDYTFYFATSVETAMKRTANRIGEDRFDKEAMSFKEGVVKGYEQLMKENKGRYIRVNANDSIDGVRRQLAMYVNNIVKMELSWMNHLAKPR